MDDGAEITVNGAIRFSHTDGEPYILTWRESEDKEPITIEFSSKEALLVFKTEFLSVLEQQGL
jgi:hypothetical protein